MGLIGKYYQEQFEITIENCYWKVEAENGINGGKNRLNVRLNCFKNKELADANTNKYSDFDFYFTPDLSVGSLNLIEQAYNAAKTLPEFINSIDA